MGGFFGLLERISGVDEPDSFVVAEERFSGVEERTVDDFSTICRLSGVDDFRWCFSGVASRERRPRLERLSLAGGDDLVPFLCPSSYLLVLGRFLNTMNYCVKCYICCIC